MKWTTKISPLVKEFELRKNPVIITVNKFDENILNKGNNHFKSGSDLMNMFFDIN